MLNVAWSRTRIKLLWHDGRGYCLLYRRLDRGVYRIPLAVPAGAQQVTVSRRELDLIFEGVDRALLRAAGRAGRASVAALSARTSVP